MNKEKLKKLRKATKKTQAQIANLLNIKQTTYSGYENGTSEPSNDMLFTIARLFDVSIDYLLDNELAEPETEEVVFMPIIARITAGFGKTPEIEYNGEKLPIPKYMVKGDTSNYFILQVQGDSMYPNYLDGDNVLMEKSDFADNGEIVAVMIDAEEATLKRIEYDEKKSYIKLVPLNPNYPPRTFTGEAMNLIRIIGISKFLIRRT
jgi:repressor LexA